MYLTEAQKTQSEDLFIALVESISNDHYDMDESYEMTEEDAYMTSILMDYFVENYKHLTLKESAYQALTGVDINEDLFNEVIELMLDESIGTFVAGAAHGIRNLLSKGALNKSNTKLNSARKSAERAGNVALQAKDNYVKINSNRTSPVGRIKASFSKAKMDKTKEKSDTALAQRKSAFDDKISTLNTHNANVANTAGLANKIDTGITNVKNKISGAINTGAHKLGSVAGRVAGAIA